MRRVLKGILITGFTAQIILGVLWMMQNFTGYQMFAADTGILYPLFLKAAKGMGKIFHIPYSYVVYVIQGGGLFHAAWLLFKETRPHTRKAQRIWMSAALVTNLIVAQCIFALLPNAFLVTCLVYEMIFGYRAGRKTGRERAAGFAFAAVFWLIASLLDREYIVFGSVVFVFLLAAAFEKKRVWAWCVGMLAVFLAAFLMDYGYDIFEKKGIYTDNSPKFEEKLFSRMTLNTFFSDMEPYEEADPPVLSWAEFIDTSLYADNLFNVTIPLLKEKLGEEGAHSFMKEYTAYAWREYKNLILHDCVWDLTGYMCAPVIAGFHMQGKGFRALTMRNYEIMSRNAPVITRWYMDYFICWFVVSLPFGLISAWLDRKKSSEEAARDKGIWKIEVCMGLIGILQAFWYMLQGSGLMDYKKTLINMLLWELLLILRPDKMGGKE